MVRNLRTMSRLTHSHSEPQRIRNGFSRQQIRKATAPPIVAGVRTSKESVFNDFTCVLQGYPWILSLREMQDKAAATHQVDIPRERKVSCCIIFCALSCLDALAIIYWTLLVDDHDIREGLMIVTEIGSVLSVLAMGMCLFRWCSLNDISPKTIWNRVAITHCSPLKLIKFDMQQVNVTYCEYDINYGQYPHKLHEPIITMIKKQKICNARDLVKITKKDADAPHSYGVMTFHFKGEDDYLLDEWKYEFNRFGSKIDTVYTICDKFHNVFHRHFENKFKYKEVECEEAGRSKYIRHQTKIHEKGQTPNTKSNVKKKRHLEANIIDIIDSSLRALTPEDVNDEEEEG